MSVTRTDPGLVDQDRVDQDQLDCLTWVDAQAGSKTAPERLSRSVAALLSEGFARPLEPAAAGLWGDRAVIVLEEPWDAREPVDDLAEAVLGRQPRRPFGRSDRTLARILDSLTRTVLGRRLAQATISEGHGWHRVTVELRLMPDAGERHG
jgi:hypothetical protein